MRHLPTRLCLPAAAFALAACGDVAPTAPAGRPTLARTGSGTTLQVNTLADHDDGACTTQDCTLREAIRLAPPGGTITFKNLSGTIALVPTAAPATLVVERSLTIQGPGAGVLTVAMQQQAGRVFRIGGSDVTISGLTITGGAALGAFVDGEGGGIYADAANLTLRDVRISGNTAERGGGLAFLGGNLLTERSTVSGNTASSGGGLYLASRGPATIVLRQSTVRDNQAAVDGAGILHGQGALALEQSTLSGNVAGSFGGALYTGGSGTTSVDRSSISGNAAGNGGGAISTWGAEPLTITSSTIAGNSARVAGGLFSYYGHDRLTNTILAGNSASDVPGNADCILGDPSFTWASSGGYNLTSPGTGCGYFPTAPGDRLVPASQVFRTTLYYYLEDNGGPTRTHRLLDPAVTGQPNPALDGGACSATADQRGFVRPVDLASVPNAAGGNGCDIGALEVQAPTRGGPRR